MKKIIVITLLFVCGSASAEQMVFTELPGGTLYVSPGYTDNSGNPKASYNSQQFKWFFSQRLADIISRNCFANAPTGTMLLRYSIKDASGIVTIIVPTITVNCASTYNAPTATWVSSDTSIAPDPVSPAFTTEQMFYYTKCSKP